MTWSGAASLEPLLVPIGDVVRDPSNPRRGDVALLAEMLGRFGQLKPIVVDSNGKIIAGNHVHRAAQERLGWTKIAVVSADHLTEDDALDYLVGDNRASDVASYDPGEHAALLRRIVERATERAQALNVRALGFVSDDELRRVIGDADRLARAESRPRAKPSLRCSHCSFTWLE